MKCIKSKTKTKSNSIATNNVILSIKTVSKHRLWVPTEQNVPEQSAGVSPSPRESLRVHVLPPRRTPHQRGPASFMWKKTSGPRLPPTPHPSDAKVGRRPWRNQRCLPTTAFPPRPSIQERSWTATHRGRTTQLCGHTTVCTHCVAGHEPTKKTTCYMKPGYLWASLGSAIFGRSGEAVYLYLNNSSAEL